MSAASWFDSAERALGVRANHFSSVSGGDINEAYEVYLSDRRVVFAKVNRRAPKGMFEAEAAGLDFLRRAGSELTIPEVIHVSPECLVLQRLETTKEDQSEELGRGLAQLHHCEVQAECGAPFDGFIGTLHQSNRMQSSNWLEFFAEQRVGAQLRLPAARRLITSDLRGRIETLLGRLDQLFSEPPEIGRLHGDLWSGNYMFARTGPAIFDPAPYFGPGEVDLAMMNLFGGFSSRVFDSYFELRPQLEGYQDRIALYQLYPLLVHVNLFGAGYLGSVSRTVDRLLQL